jgi:PKD repeat protein
MFDTASHTYHIFKLNRSTETWTDTGTQIDNRSNTHADMLWSGGHLYAASAVIAASSTQNVTGQPARLYRYSYNSGTQTYSLDTGFPVNINNVSSESITLDRDSQGVLWATWTQAQSVYVNSSTGSDSTWGAAFGGSRIGLMWSNQVTSTFYFATHTDSVSDRTAWTGVAAVSSPSIADDHMNLKQLDGDNQGHLFAAVKTSLDDRSGSSPTDPQVLLLARDPSTGRWGAYTAGTLADCETRPQVVLDSVSQVIYVFTTAPSSGCPFSGTAGTIYVKSSPMNNISFVSGRGTPVMNDAASPNLNNVTGTKQSVSPASGLVMMASNDVTNRYWHTDMSLGSGVSAPVASFTATPTSGQAPLAVSFTDTSTGPPTSWLWNFGDGSTSTAQNPSHTYTSAGTYTVSLQATNSAGTNTVTRPSLITVQSPSSGGVTFGGATTAQSAATTTVTLTKPAQAAVGDVLVANFTTDNHPTIASVPAGWTSLLASTPKPAGASLFAYYHVVTSSDVSVSNWTWTLSAAQKWGGGLTRYVGVSQTHPIDTTVSTAIDSTGNASTITVPSVTTQTNGAMIIGGIGADGATPTTTQPTGWSEAWENSGTKVAEQAYTAQASAGVTGAATWTLSAPRGLAGWMTALRAG